MKRVILALLVLGALPMEAKAQDDVWNITLGQGLNLLSVPQRAATTRLLTLEDLRAKTGAQGIGRVVIDPATGRTRWEMTYLPSLTSNQPLEKGVPYFLLMRSFMTVAVHSNPMINPSQKLIVFVTDRWASASSPGIGKLALMNEDGSEQRPLMPSEVNTPRHQIDPSWSPDGTWIYFANQEVTGNVTKFSIARVRIDGTGFERVTNRNADGSFNGSMVPHRYPRVDFGGEYLFYTQYRTSGSQTIEGDIYRMKLDGSELVNLTPNTSASDDAYAIATADRRYVVFTSSRSGKYQVWRMGWDGSTPEQVTEDPASAGLSDVASNDSGILYVGSSHGVNVLYVTSVNGGTPRRILSTDVRQDDGSFSGDVSKIALTLNKSGDTDIHFMNADGESLIQITFNNGADYGPIIQP